MLEKKIEQLGAYFDGMFRIDNTRVGVRVVIPDEWKSYDKKTDNYMIINYKINDNGINKILFVGNNNSSFEDVIDFVFEVITNNLENEKKKKLFNIKYLELAKIFDSNRLAKLENLIFKFEKNKKIKNNTEITEVDSLEEKQLEEKQLEEEQLVNNDEFSEIRRLAKEED